MRGAQESEADKAAREQARRMAEVERTDANQKLATGLTSDFRQAYGSRFSLFDLLRKK